MSAAAELHDIRWLDRSHGEGLLELSRACPIEADFTFRFARDPDFFAWPNAAFIRYGYRGLFIDDLLVGVGLIALANGRTGAGEVYGYGGDLRVHPAHRRRGLATALTRDLLAHLPDEAECGYVLVKEGNEAVRRVPELIGARGAPNRVISVVAMNVPLVRRLTGPGLCAVRRAGPHDVEELAALYDRAYARRPFAPLLPAERLARDAVTVPGLALENTFLAEKRGRLVGALAAWDQDTMRRTVLIRYTPLGQLQRAAFRAAGLLFGSGVAMPPPGQALRQVTVARLAVDGDDPAVLADLLATVTHELVGRGAHLLTLGCAEGDPLLSALRGTFAVPFRSRLVVRSIRNATRPPLPPGMNRPYVELAVI